MSEPEHVYTTSQIRKETRDLIIDIRRKRWRYLAIVILLGSYFFYFFKYHLLDYSATATFVVNEPSFISATPLDQGLPTIDNFNRIYELVNSVPTQKHIIDKFKLLEHYGIDSTDEFYFQKAVAALRSTITVKKNPFNTISITVKDRYRYLAAEIANEMVSYIETQNQAYFISIIQKRIKISEAYVTQIEKENKQKISEIDSLINKLNVLLFSGKLNEKNYNDLLSQQESLSALVFKFEYSTQDLVNSQKLYNLALQALNFQVFPTLNVIGTAMPAYKSTVMTAMLYSILAMILVFLLLVLQGYLFIYYKEYIKLILTGK